MKLVVGLGNPGQEYKTTRHNVGFLVIDAFVESYSSATWTTKHKGSFCKLEGSAFLKPETFMNLSGHSVLSASSFYKTQSSDILVIYDDLYLPEGEFKFSCNKSSGGHNGVRSVIEMLGAGNFLSLRIGIGPRERASRISEYVLEKFSQKSMDVLFSIYPTLFEAIKDFINGASLSYLQNKYNHFSKNS